MWSLRVASFPFEYANEAGILVVIYIIINQALLIAFDIIMHSVSHVVVKAYISFIGTWIVL